MSMMNIAIILALAGGGAFLMFTKQGQEMIAGLTEGLGTAEAAEEEEEDEIEIEDPFKYMNKKNYKAWKAGSDEWKDIQKRVAKNNYIEAYLADAYY